MRPFLTGCGAACAAPVSELTGTLTPAADTRQNWTSAHAHAPAHHHAGNLNGTDDACHGVCLPSDEVVLFYHRESTMSIEHNVYTLFFVAMPHKRVGAVAMSFRQSQWQILKFFPDVN